MKLPWMKFYFLNLSRIREAKQHNQLAVSNISMAYRYLENEIRIVVCKSLQLHGDALDISNGANMWSCECPVLPVRGQTWQEIRHLCHQGQVSASHPSSVSDHKVHKTCSGLYLPPVPTKTWCSPSPSSLIADQDHKGRVSFFPSFLTRSWNEHYQSLRNGKSLSRASMPS